MKFLHQVAEEITEQKGKTEELLAKLEKVCKSVGGKWKVEDREVAYWATCNFSSPKRGSISIYNTVGEEKSILLNFGLFGRPEEYIIEHEAPKNTSIAHFKPNVEDSLLTARQPDTFYVRYTDKISGFKVAIDKSYENMELEIF